MFKTNYSINFQRFWAAYCQLSVFSLIT